MKARGVLDATYAQLDWFMAKRDPELSYANSRAAELSYVVCFAKVSCGMKLMGV